METVEDLRAGGDGATDRALFEAFAFESPPGATAAADRRVRAAIERARRGEGRVEGRDALGGVPARLADRFARTSRRGRAAALVAAVLILGGAGGGLLGLYEGMVGSGGGWRTAWDRAAVLEASQTVDGYRVTIERAYVDQNQMMLALSAYDLEGRGWTQVAATSVEVIDEQGRSFGHTMAESVPDGAVAAANLAWLTPPAGLAPGAHAFRVTVPSISVRDATTPPPDESPGTVKAGDWWSPWHEVAGPWTFTMSLEVPGGSVARPDAVAAVGGAEVRLTQVTVSPSSVSATVEVVAGGGGEWAPIGRFEHAGRAYPIITSSNAGVGGSIAVLAFDGTADASGDWTLRVDELVGLDGTEQVRLAGPWIIPFSMP